MKQLLTKIWQAVKCCIKWILIQYAVLFCLSFLYYGSLYIWAVFSDYSFRNLSIIHQIGGHTVYSWYTALLFAIPNYTVLFSIWHMFFNKKKQWWTILVPWGFYLVWVYLEIAKGLDWNYKIITVDEYMFTGWLSPSYGAFVQGLFLLHRKKRTANREKKEYDSMIDYVRGMYNRVSLTHEDIESHLQKATEEELENLISISKTVSPEERYPGYYIPNDRNFITYSFEKHPDRVYHLKKFDQLSPNKDFEEIDTPFKSNWKLLSFDEMNKDYYVFYFDSFGLPETHLCARAGYAIYDPDIKDMVAHAFMWMS